MSYTKVDERFKKAQNVAFMGITCNLCLAVIKVWAGLAFSSQAILSDAVNSIGDIFSSVVTFLGNRIASVPKDNDHQYGHGKAEALGALFIGVILIFAAGKMFINALDILKEGSSVNFSWVLIGVSLLVIAVKFCMYIYASGIGKKFDNPLVMANAKDHRSDLFVTSAAIISILLSKFELKSMDAVAGMGISAWIVIQGLGILKESSDMLMDKSMNKEDTERIISSITEVDGVSKVQAVTTRNSGTGYSVVVRIGVDCTFTVAEGHDIASRVKKEVEKNDRVTNVIVHVNPIYPGKECDHLCSSCKTHSI